LELLRKESLCKYSNDNKRPEKRSAEDKEIVAVIFKTINNTEDTQKL
jgi:hypothetical protein